MIAKDRVRVAGNRSDNRIALTARHLVAMLIAMVVGMLTLYPLWKVAVGSFAADTWLDSFEVDLLAMATVMTIPMVAWMIRRGDSRTAAGEMGAAMYAAFLLPIIFHWLGALDEMTVMVIGHVLMVVFMIALAWRHTGGHSESDHLMRTHP